MRIAVYTCVTGSYEIPQMPLLREEFCDYYMISDDPELAGKVYQWIDVDKVVSGNKLDSKDKNRYCKLHPYELFPEYDYSIYLDGSIQIKRSISHYVSKTGSCGLAMHKHRRSRCIYLEGIILTWLGVVNNDENAAYMRRLAEEGFPRNYGMYECGMIVTDLNNPQAALVYQKWYDEYLKGVKRDQQALMYILWKMGLGADSVGNLGGEYNIYTNPDIQWHRKSHYK